MIYSCSRDQSKESLGFNNQMAPKRYFLKSSENVSVNGDTVYLNRKKYSGFIYQLYPKTNDTISLEGFKNGLLTGICRKWYPNTQLMEERVYSDGKKNGRQIAYWENGNKKFEFFAKNDAYEGELKEWAFDGKLIHLAHYLNGQEEGAQKLWYDSGKIRANYIVIKGKRYGLLGTKNCKNVSDSIFVTK